MPLFSRADRKPKPPGRFSFRKHEAPDARGSLSSSASSSGGLGRRKKPRDVVNPPPPVSSSSGNPPLHNKPSSSHKLSASVASTAASSSVSSSRLSASVRSSTSTARSTSPTIIESFSGDTDTGSDTEGARDSRDSTDDLRMAAGRPPTATTTNASPLTARGVRNSLVDYRQLRCSMSYKNRIESQQRTGSASSMGLRGSEDRSRASTDESAYYVATTPSSTYSSSSPAFARSSTRISEVASEADRAEDAPSRASRVSSRASVHRQSSAASARPRPSEDASAPERRSETPMTEANVAAMQTRRAFQQMVLAMKGSSSDDEEFSDDDDVSDDDVSSSEDEYSSSSSKFPRASSMRTTVATSTATASARGGVVRLGADEYRKFQFRLRQLEDMCAEQAHKQAYMDEAIEREVALRTRAVVAAMDKKIEMYRQAKALECEREIARRVSEMDVGRGSSSRRSLLLSSSSRMSYSNPSITESELKGKPLEKIFHPRRARARRVQRLQEIEEQQKREMEQFRAFIQSTESRTFVQSPDTESSNEADLADILQRDPPPTVEELAELVVVLRQHVDVQEKQLGEAKKIINAAIDAREEAERMAEEAVALTMQLDSRLDRASREMNWVRDELSQSMLLPPKEFSARASRVLSAPMFMTPPVRAEDDNEDKRASSRITEEES